MNPSAQYRVLGEGEGFIVIVLHFEDQDIFILIALVHYHVPVVPSLHLMDLSGSYTVFYQCFSVECGRFLRKMFPLSCFVSELISVISSRLCLLHTDAIYLKKKIVDFLKKWCKLANTPKKWHVRNFQNNHRSILQQKGCVFGYDNFFFFVCNSLIKTV